MFYQTDDRKLWLSAGISVNLGKANKYKFRWRISRAQILLKQQNNTILDLSLGFSCIIQCWQNQRQSHEKLSIYIAMEWLRSEMIYLRELKALLHSFLGTIWISSMKPLIVSIFVHGKLTKKFMKPLFVSIFFSSQIREKISTTFNNAFSSLKWVISDQKHSIALLGPVQPKKIVQILPENQMISLPYRVCSQIDLHRKFNTNYPACPTKKSR